MGGMNERVISKDSNEILLLFSTLININKKTLVTTNRSRIFYALVFVLVLEFRSESTTRSIDPSDRLLEISKREIPSIIARTLQQVFSPFQQTRFLRCGQIKQRIVLCPFFMYDTKALHRRACVRAHTHIHTHTSHAYTETVPLIFSRYRKIR